MSDAKLPFRKNKSAHKGTYGHTSVFACQKSGAAILAATSALNFGSGLTSLIKTSFSDLDQFKISPELMINDLIPAKTTAIVLGPGFCEDEKLYIYGAMELYLDFINIFLRILFLFGKHRD